MPDATTMQAAAIDRFGEADELKPHKLSIPKIRADEVLLRIDTAGVGVWDPSLRTGEFVEDGKLPHFPYVLGVEGAGIVERVGDDVEDFAEGDRVWSYSEDLQRGGFYAEYVAVKADHVALVPKGLNLEAAGAMPADAITALCGLEELEIKTGDKLAIFGASGGIGHLALQLAQRMGASVIAIASGKDGLELVQQLGADAAVDGHGAGLAKAIKAFAPDRLDAALITANGEGLDAVLKALRPGARMAYPNGVEPEPMAPGGVTVHAYDGESTPDRLTRLNRLIEQGPFHVHIAAKYRLDQAADAHRGVARHHLGKIALKVAH